MAKKDPDYPKLKQVFICKTLMGHRFESMDAVTYNILLNKTKKKWSLHPFKYACTPL